MPGDRGGRSHGGRNKVRTPLEALPSFKIPVGGGRTTFVRLQPILVHRQAHRTSRLTPVETGSDEYLVETLGLGLFLDQPGARNDHRIDARIDRFSLDHLGNRAQILDAPVGAGANEDTVNLDIGDLCPGFRPI